MRFSDPKPDFNSREGCQCCQNNSSSGRYGGICRSARSLPGPLLDGSGSPRRSSDVSDTQCLKWLRLSSENPSRRKAERCRHLCPSRFVVLVFPPLSCLLIESARCGCATMLTHGCVLAQRPFLFGTS